MKTTIAAASFVLIAALSGLATAHASGFNDRTAIPTVTSTRAAPQDLRHFPVVHGFNQQSHHADAASRFPTRAADRTRATAGVHCDLAPRFGFQNSSSFASC
jgi:hypothetical protein